MHAICNLGRSVPARLYGALLERDRCCVVVPGCSATCNLEIDHRVVPFAEGGPTELSNLARICHRHHFLKTHEGYKASPGPGCGCTPMGAATGQVPCRPEAPWHPRAQTRPLVATLSPALARRGGESCHRLPRSPLSSHTRHDPSSRACSPVPAT